MHLVRSDPDGRTWMHVFGPDGNLGREVTREVLNTTLVGLGRFRSGYIPAIYGRSPSCGQDHDVTFE
jgi:hypothetical protein